VLGQPEARRARSPRIGPAVRRPAFSPDGQALAVSDVVDTASLWGVG